MKILVAMDKLNGVISSYQVNRYVEEAIASQTDHADIVQISLFNRRHELLNSVLLWHSGTKYKVNIHNADMNEIETIYGQTKEGTVIIESNLFSKDHKAIEQRTSFGLGEVTLDALNEDTDHIIISLDGMDSFDGGVGVLQALGAKFYDDEDRELDAREGAQIIKFICHIDISGLPSILENVRLQVMTNFSSRLYGKNSEIMELSYNHQIPYKKVVEIDNLIWYLNEIMRNELHIVLGPIERGGAGGGVIAVLKALYNTEILTSHELVNQITHLDELVSQTDLTIFGEGLKEEDHMLETTTLTIAELTEKYHKPSIAICATNDKFDIFNHHRVIAMFNTFIEVPKTYTDFKMDLQIRCYTVQALRLLKTTAKGVE